MEQERFQISVNNVYSKLNECIIIGLTGRTGSGCSTAAKLLQTESFSELRLPTSLSNNNTDCEQRKYSIIYNYMRNKWEPFDVIEVSSIILSFAFEKTFDEFILFIKSLIDSEANKNINRKTDR